MKKNGLSNNFSGNYIFIINLNSTFKIVFPEKVLRVALYRSFIWFSDTKKALEKEFDWNALLCSHKALIDFI